MRLTQTRDDQVLYMGADPVGPLDLLGAFVCPVYLADGQVAVVGGGIIGCSVAFHLAQAGVGVRLLERGEVGGEASGVAAGMLLPVSEAGDKGPMLSWGLSVALDPPMSVRTQPGLIVMHVKPSGRSSAAIERVNMFSAALLSRYP